MSFSKCIFRNNDMNATTIATMKQISATFDMKSNVESVSRRFMGKYKPKILSVNLQSDSLHQTFLERIQFYSTLNRILSKLLPLKFIIKRLSWMVVVPNF